MNATEKLMRHFATRLTELNKYYGYTVTLDELVDAFVDMDENLVDVVGEKDRIQDAWFEANSIERSPR